MARIWSDEGKLATWLEVEQAATAAWAELGVVPDEAAARIAEATPPSAERVAELEATLHHDTAAFVDAVAERLGEEGRWFHYGLTSSDVVDTALSLQVRDAGALILAGLDRAFATVTARAAEHRETLQIGRTHGVHAEPTTLGLKLAGWAFELARGRERVARALEGMRVGKLSGAVGTYAATDPELERLACERLGLEPAPTSTQILQRDRHAELLTALAVVASSLAAFLALDYMLERFAWLVEGLVVRPERMRRNLESSHFLFFSQRVLNALVEAGLARADAYRLVQRAAIRAWDEELDFRELCRGDDEIASRLDLDSAFDLGAYTRHIDTVFARLEALKEEPLHA